MNRRGKVIPFPRVPPPPPEATPDSVLVEVQRCLDQGEALVVRGLLDSEGIPSVLRGRLVHSLHPFSVGEQGAVRVFVHHADAERARAILSRPPTLPPSAEPVP